MNERLSIKATSSSLASWAQLVKSSSSPMPCNHELLQDEFLVEGFYNNHQLESYSEIAAAEFVSTIARFDCDGGEGMGCMSGQKDGG